MDPGKIFVGGISWETNEDRLREYFQTFGEVVEAVIMKDRNTGRARGFGFVIYADPLVAERVVKQKHVIDGRAVEAKKAVPRDDQPVLIKSGSTSAHGSPGPIRTKKIFVGGLASTVTENDFKSYFDQFGNITDVVVMYDHNTQRPRGFGFITYDSEEAVEQVLIKTFHELNGKMVEVKRAIPKELSAGPSRSLLSGSFGFHRVGSFLNGYNPSLFGGLGARMDDRLSPVSVGRSGFPLFGPTSYGTPLGNEMRMSPNNRESMNLMTNMANMGYERGFNSLHSGGNTKWNDNFAEYDGIDRMNGSSFNSTSWSLWGNGNNTGSANPANSPGAFNRIEAIWGSSPVSGQTGGNSPGSIRGINYGRTDVSIGLNHGNNLLSGSSVSAANGGFESNNLQDLYDGTDTLSWLSSAPELKGSFEFGMGNATSEVSHKNPGLCW